MVIHHQLQVIAIYGPDLGQYIRQVARHEKHLRASLRST